MKVLFLNIIVSIFFSSVSSQSLELDGNAETDISFDWEDLYLDSTGQIYTGVIDDPSPLTTFTTGQSKDTNDVSQWKHKSSSVPDKDDITNAYAYAANDNDDLVVYFGGDRYSNSGDSSFGFWFFQENVEPLIDGTFNGNHRDGDLLVLADFGSTNQIVVYEWIDGGVSLLLSNEDAECDEAKNQTICAVTNSIITLSPWPYVPKEGIAGYFPPLSFIEGKMNLNEIFANQTDLPCFTSFLAETRSSTSINAQLKDFVYGEFGICNIVSSIECPFAELSENGLELVYIYNITVENDGFGTLYDINVYYGDDIVGNFSILLKNEVKFIIGNFTSQNIFVTTESGNVTALPHKNSLEEDKLFDIFDAGEAECPVLNFTLSIDVIKECFVELEEINNFISLRIDYDVVFCNSGELLIHTFLITETYEATATQIYINSTLDLGECLLHQGYYYPSINVLNFTDSIEIEAKSLFGLSVPSSNTTAQCELC